MKQAVYTIILIMDDTGYFIKIKQFISKWLHVTLMVIMYGRFKSSNHTVYDVKGIFIQLNTIYESCIKKMVIILQNQILS